LETLAFGEAEDAGVFGLGGMDGNDLVIALEAITDRKFVAGKGTGDFDGSSGAKVEGEAVGAGTEEEGVAVG
jgi:hypothetical protein